MSTLRSVSQGLNFELNLQRYEKGFWLMSSLTALFVIFSLMLFLYNEYERGT